MWRRLKALLSPGAQSEVENQRLRAFLRAVPIEYCGWNQDQALAVSAGFCTVMGIEAVYRLEDIQSALIPGDAAALEGLYDRLQDYGENFEIGVSTLDRKRALKIFGKRGALDEGQEIFNVLWVMDITDLAQAALKSVEMLSQVEKRENELRSMLNAVPLPVWMRGENLDLVWCNRAYARLVDDTPAAVIADRKELRMTGAEKGAAPRLVAQRALARAQAHVERMHVVADGDRRLLEIMEMPFSVQGSLTLGCAVDVTREEELQKDIERQVLSNRQTLEQLRSPIAMFDAETKLEFYNAGWEHLWGIESSFLDKQPRLLDLLEKLREMRKLPEQADYKQFKQQWLGLFTSLHTHEEMLYLPDGAVLHMVALPRPQGGLIMTFEDVTSRLELETSYNTLIAVQRETIDSLSEGLAVFGEDGRLKLFNPAYASMWNLSQFELESIPHISYLVDRKRRFFDDAEWEKTRDVLASTALQRESRRGRIDRADGRVYEFVVAPLPDGNMLNAWFDITDKIMAERALIEKNAALEEAEKLKTDFLANVSYQLRTPLNALIGFAEILNQQYFGPLNDRQMEYTAGMLDAGQRLVSLINDILDLSTIEAGYMSLYPSDVDVDETVQSVASLVSDWARRQQLTLTAQVQDAGMITADERRLKQVLLNLVGNAINYTPAGGQVEIFARQSHAGWIEIGVRDTGRGMSSEDLKRIFLPFQKAQGHDVQRRTGAGLGLTLVKNIVELHGGHVAIESREGKGTTVTCTLPVSLKCDIGQKALKG